MAYGNNSFFKIYKSGELITLEEAQRIADEDFLPALYTMDGSTTISSLHYCFSLLNYLERFKLIDDFKFLGNESDLPKVEQGDSRNVVY